jgi:hypothetical protein
MLPVHELTTNAVKYDALSGFGAEPQPQPHSYRPRLGRNPRGVSVVVTQETALAEAARSRFPILNPRSR